MSICVALAHRDHKPPTELLQNYPAHHGNTHDQEKNNGPHSRKNEHTTINRTVTAFQFAELIMHSKDNDWPMTVNAIKSEPTVDISKLDTQEKHQIWKGIKRTNPNLAEVLSNDPVIANIKATFQASIILTEVDAKRYLKAGHSQQSNG